MMAWRLLTRMTMKPISVLPSILVVVSNHIKGTNVSFRPSHALKNSIQIEEKDCKNYSISVYKYQNLFEDGKVNTYDTLA